MEEKVARKKYNHNHASNCKGGEKMGLSNRFVRAIKAGEVRKKTRLDEFSKRRMMPLGEINKHDNTLEESTHQEMKPKKSGEGDAPAASRKERLQKWLEEREMKRKAEAATKTKKAFVVRHIVHDDTKVLNKAQKTTKMKPSKENVPTRRVTRASARLASKQENILTNKKLAKEKIERKENTLPGDKKAVKSNNGSTKLANKQENIGPNKTKPDAKTPANANKPGKEITKQTKTLEESEIGTDIRASVKEKEKNRDKTQSIDCSSIAPDNFTFTAPTGVSSFLHLSQNFKFKPLSPSSAEGFFSGIACPSPENPRELITKENFALGGTDWVSKQAEAEAANKGISTDTSDIPMETVQTTETAQDAKEETEPEKGSLYFRMLVTSETDKLNKLCACWDKVLEEEEELSDEVTGSIRTAVGQAQLLISQRFKQFSGLIDLSEDPTAKKKATPSDLQGFWDMIYFQVEDVYNKMEALEKRRQNNWIEEAKPVKKKLKRVKPKVAKPDEAKAAAHAKSAVQEMRAKMRAKMAENKRKAMESQKEDCSFITILTPVKNKATANAVVLTPVRRSVRNTPLNRVAMSNAVPVVTTPKLSSTSPGLRLTPDASSTLVSTLVPIEPDMAASQEDKAKAVTKDTPCAMDVEGTSSEESTSDNVSDESMPTTAGKRSALRKPVGKRTRKSSRVSFQTPRAIPESIAGGTPGPLATPGVTTKSRNALTPVAVSIDMSEDIEGTPVEPKGTPLRRSSRKRQLTPYHSGKGKSRLGEDHAEELVPAKQAGAPARYPVNSVSDSDDEGARGKALLGSTGRSAKKEDNIFLPEKYLMPSSTVQKPSLWLDDSLESHETSSTQTLTPRVNLVKHAHDTCAVTPSEQKTPMKTTLFVSPQSPSQADPALITVTPVEKRITRSHVTPLLGALSLGTTPDSASATRCDSVFFAPSDSGAKPVLDNLICFSPLLE
ncbi:disks large-associated protein 5 isoform X1 [Nematostella vectensis]|uniref:disks large-associated protein 5 isoform X1 n=1 Tax=Nematostella vectensis TaxID=45351 RepID=UPI0013900126|nr:disks large-associated protein 5 isoform X1 [Nematostella vectensis]